MAILIIETGNPPGNMPEQYGTTATWFKTALSEIGKRAEIVRPWQGDEMPVPTSVSGAIITGSWSMVTDKEPWSERLAEWIRQANVFDIPMFGVCYGHQLMSYALGGTVGYNPNGGEQGSLDVTLTETGQCNLLLDGFPKTFKAYLYHQQSVLEPPSGAEILAGSEKDPHQMIRYSASAFSVQFHPEFTMDIIRAAFREDHAQTDPSELDVVGETPWSRRILHNFCHVVEDIG